VLTPQPSFSPAVEGGREREEKVKSPSGVCIAGKSAEKYLMLLIGRPCETRLTPETTPNLSTMVGRLLFGRRSLDQRRLFRLIPHVPEIDKDLLGPKAPNHCGLISSIGRVDRDCAPATKRFSMGIWRADRDRGMSAQPRWEYTLGIGCHLVHKRTV